MHRKPINGVRLGDVVIHLYRVENECDAPRAFRLGRSVRFARTTAYGLVPAPLSSERYVREESRLGTVSPIYTTGKDFRPAEFKMVVFRLADEGFVFSHDVQNICHDG